MGKIENLEKYIEMCEDDFWENEDRLSFIKEVEGIYTNEIECFRTGLNLYEEFLIGELEIDFEGDIKRIKNKLINYKHNLELEAQKRKDELELARLKQSNINLSANANNSNNINIQITLEQAIEVIREIPDELMTKDDKDDLEDKISGIDASVKSGKKEKAKEKIARVLKFLADKGADALIAMLPYLGQMAGIIQNIK